MNKYARYVVATILFLLFTPLSVSGHFIWIERDKESGEIRAYFGEEPKADKHALLDRVMGTEVWLIKDGEAQSIPMEKFMTGDYGYLVSQYETVGNEIDASCVYGVFSRGESKMLLNYCAKYAAINKETELAKKSKLALNVLPKIAGETLSFEVAFTEKPAVGSEFIIIGPDKKSQTLKTDDKGRVEVGQAVAGRYLIRARHVDETPGKHEGQDYVSKNYYCTLVLDVMDKSDDATKNVSYAKTIDDSLPNIPVGITSFGGALAGRHLYIYGGNAGGAHGYYKGGQNATLYRLNLDDPQKWEAVNTSKGLQGLGMVQHDGKIYRLGGFEARNAKGEDNDLYSVAEFAVFDHEKNQWQQLAPMPVARSSFDAALVGDVVYVVGGWTLDGDNSSQWLDSAYKFDLSDPGSGWQELPKPPFVRRAMSVAFQGDKLYVIGGMEESNNTTRDVAVFDTKTTTWSEGPELPDTGNRMEGFGNSSFNVGGELVVSTASGNVYKLNKSGTAWEKITELKSGRFFHRLLPISDDQFVLVGGTDMATGKALNIELLSKDQH